ncbi:MAG: serine/threonine-protein phosphatase [Desulfobacterales bacterium]|nr:serine/threonine-protein phosphatase [Desulfobacterales bacterium]
MTMVESAGITDVGRKRKANEDSIFIDDRMRLYIVADGMGGHKAGEVASRVVVETIRDSMHRFMNNVDAGKMAYARKDLSPAANQLLSSIHLANQTVFQLSQTQPSYDGMGSTASVVFLSGKSLIAANVGDSPIYLIREGKIETISTPHTYVAELAALDPVAAEKLSEQYRHMITRGMGLKEEVKPDVREIKAKKGDRVVICSDGLSDKASPEDIRSAIDGKPTKASCKALVNMANERGGDDNITVIVLQLPSGTAKTDDAPKAPRGPISVDIDTEEASHTGFIEIHDAQGGHIKTTDPYTVGEELTLTFANPKKSGYFTVSAKIVLRDADGIEISFEHMDGETEKKLMLL